MSKDQKYEFIYQAAREISCRILTSRDDTDNIEKHLQVLDLLAECINICDEINRIRVREETDEYVKHNTKP